MERPQRNVVAIAMAHVEVVFVAAARKATALPMILLDPVMLAIREARPELAGDQEPQFMQRTKSRHTVILNAIFARVCLFPTVRRKISGAA